MKIVVDINHPADVHLFKNFIYQMEKKGHDVIITATKKDVSIQLLDNYGFDYINLGSYGTSLIKKLVNTPMIDLKMYNAIKRIRPDIFIGLGSVRASHISRLMRRPYISFDDTEHATKEHILYMPFTDVICTPSCFNKDLGRKQIRVNSYKELAYLHPNYFKPDSSILNDIGIDESEKFIILRFVSWNAIHDIGQHGIQDKITLVGELEKYGKVLITSESCLDKKLEKYKINIPPEKIHDLMYYASLYIGEGATMATECAILGTPSIYISSLTGEIGNLLELEQRYDLIYSYKDQNIAMKKAIELLQKPCLKEEWKKKRENLIKDKIDIVKFMIWLVENYPESIREIEENRQYNHVDINKYPNRCQDDIKIISK